MKKLLIISVFFLLNYGIASAQRFAYVDVQYILNEVPEYHEAQKEVDGLAADWQKEVEKMYKEIEELYKKYQAEQVLAPEETQRRREEEIMEKERKAKEYQRLKFGPEGDLFKKRQELIKPIQDKIYNAIEKLATEKRYDFIFDKSAGTTVLYANSDLDKSSDILKMLGY